ncbi:hypothetical protein QBC46DRAFT_434347 [Diplogelasinospora grovesii]|uniref:PKS/mFAS DH domain-containing protein n=1 Tax=Diplogelasinospora grovesii TaxID=303347 RepID=A0AAN6MWD8_9PEZI|nr:hypothetical protein QBC46DRAFT_434347 [Diplogelasinospora grovesii]
MAVDYFHSVAGHIVQDVSGTVEVRTDAAAVSHEFSRYERLTGPEAIEALYQDPESESIRGAMLYKMFSRVVEYGEAYRGLKSVAAKSGRIAGTVVSVPRADGDQSITRPPTLDSFMQVSGIHANSIYPCADNEVYVFTKLDRLQFGPGFERDSATKRSTSSWLIFSNLAASGSKELTNDIFVFDSISKRLVVLILGARFNNVRLSSLSKVLSKVNGPTNESIKSQTTLFLNASIKKHPNTSAGEERNNAWVVELSLDNFQYMDEECGPLDFSKLSLEDKPRKQ